MTLTLSHDALAAIGHHAVASGDGMETGGILLGHDRGQRIDVLHAGGPGPAAQRRADFFCRDIGYAQQFALDAWASDRSIWIGEWHTHLRWSARPSPLDLYTYRNLLADPALGLDRFVAVIVTATDDRWQSCRATGWTITARTIRRADIIRHHPPSDGPVP